MDQATLVKSGTGLIRLLDQTDLKPDVAMWVHYDDIDSWKLWISPNRQVSDKLEFYRIVDDQITAHPQETEGLDVSATEYVPQDSERVRALRRLMSLPDLGTKYLTGNMVDGYYVPEGIAIRVR